MAPPKDIARSYPKRGLTADVGFRSEPFFCGDGSFDSTQNAGNAIQFDPDFTFTNGLSVTYWMWHNGENATRYNGFFGQVAFGSISAHTLRFHSKQLGASYDVANAFEARSWHHVCFTLSQDGTAVKCYLNGVEQTLSAQPASALTLPSGSGITDAGIATFQNNASAGVLSMGGHMAKYALYNAVLTEDQVRQIMRAQTFAEVNAIQACQFYFELAANNTDSTGNATTVEDRGTVTYGVTKPQLPRGLDLARGAAMARVYTGRAVDFDGSADRLTAAHYNPSGDYLTTTAWVNADTLRGQGLIHNGDTGRNAFLFYMSGATGDLDFYWNDTTGDARIRHQTQLLTGQWYHLAAVMDMSDAADHQVTWYINGIAATGTRTSSSWVGDNTYQFGNQYSSAGWFDGKIADCRIFDVELTQAQIRELYHNPEQVLPTGVSASNLRRYYPLSDYNDTGGTGGRYFQDMGADGEAAEDKGSALMAFAQPVPCPQLGLQQSATRLFFAGDTSQVVTASSVTSLGNSFAVAFWVQKDAGVQMFIETNLTDQIYYDGSQLYYYSASGGSNILTGASMPPGEWHHVVVTYGAVYLNGASVATFSSGGWFGTTNYFGRRASAAMPFNGIMANVTYWDENLTSAEALELYNQGIGYDPRNDTGNYTSSSDVVHYWKFDDLTTVIDRVGSANATVTGTFAAASFPENASGSTIVGDFTLKRRGVSVLNKTENDNDVIAIIPASADVFPTSQGFTCSVWVRGRKTTGNAYIVATSNGSTDQRYGIYTQNAANLWGLEMPVSASPTTADAAITYDPNEWACLSFTLDFGTNTVKMYTNGALQTTVVRTLVLPTTFSDINIGGSGVRHLTITGTTPVALFKVAQRTWSDDEVERNYYSDLRLIKGLNNE